MLAQRLGAALLLAGLCVPAFAAAGSDLVVTDRESAQKALATAAPGQTIVFADGDYDLGRVTLSVAATADRPLTLVAQHAGRARLVGRTGFVLRRAAHVTISGFDFATTDAAPAAILGSHDIHLTQNWFHVNETPAVKPNLRWVEILGLNEAGQPSVNSGHNHIDHNLFEGKHTAGNYIGISGITPTGGTPQISQDDRIDHNILRDIGPRIPNGMEAIRVGLSGLSLSRGNTVIEENLFERCDGDPEVVSIKTCDAIVKGNVFRACEGGVCLRHGNRNQVVENIFLGEDRKGTDGVRVYGDDHQVLRNIFSRLTGPALQVSNGDADYGVDYKTGAWPEDRKLLALHLRPRHILLAGNKIIDCARPIVLGTPFGDRSKQVPAQDIKFAENLITMEKNGVAIQIVNAPEGLVWQRNTVALLLGAKLGLPESPAGIQVSTDTIVELKVDPVEKDTGPDWLPANKKK